MLNGTTSENQNKNSGLICWYISPPKDVKEAIPTMWLFEYETPKVIKVQSIPLGILRVLLKILVVVFVIAYELWHCRGYQKFTLVESCCSTKIKGYAT